MSLILIYITNKDRDEAKRVAKHLLDKKLIACANIFPIDSMYWWNKKIEKTEEHVVIAKSLDKNFEKIKTEVKKIHSYKIPCIIKIDVESNEEFENWIRKEVR